MCEHWKELLLLSSFPTLPATLFPSPVGWGQETECEERGTFPCRYDDYDYGEVNELLERNLKVYIKTVACYPEKTTRRMYSLFWRHFRHSEKVLPEQGLQGHSG